MPQTVDTAKRRRHTIAVANHSPSLLSSPSGLLLVIAIALSLLIQGAAAGVCGDGVLDAGEQCDPGSPGVTDTACPGLCDNTTCQCPASASSTVSLSSTPTPTVSVSSTATPTQTPTISESATPTPSVTPTISESSTVSASTTSTASASVTPTISESSTVSASATPTISASATVSDSATPSVSASATPSVSLTSTITASATPTVSESSTVSASATPTISASSTVSISATPSVSASSTVSGSATPTQSNSDTPTPSGTASSSLAPSATPSSTATLVPSSSATATLAPSSSGTAAVSPSPSVSASASLAPSASATPSPSASASPTPSNGGGGGGGYQYSGVERCYGNAQSITLSRTAGPTTSTSTSYTLRWYFGVVWPSTAPELHVVSLRDDNGDPLEFPVATSNGTVSLTCTEAFGDALVQVSFENATTQLALSWRYDAVTCQALTESLDAANDAALPTGASIFTESAVLVLDSGDLAYGWELDAQNAESPSALEAYALATCTLPHDNTPESAIRPFLACFTPASSSSDGLCTAGFGYTNPNAGWVRLSAATARNALTPAAVAERAVDMPAFFQSGTVPLAFTVRYPCNKRDEPVLAWRVRTPLPLQQYELELPDDGCVRSCAQSLREWFEQCPASVVHARSLSVLDDTHRMVMRCANSAPAARASVPHCD